MGEGRTILNRLQTNKNITILSTHKNPVMLIGVLACGDLVARTPIDIIFPYIISNQKKKKPITYFPATPHPSIQFQTYEIYRRLEQLILTKRKGL